MKQKKLCEVCGRAIPLARLSVLPDTSTCVQCSTTRPYSEEEIIGFSIADYEANRPNLEDLEDGDNVRMDLYPNEDYSFDG